MVVHDSFITRYETWHTSNMSILVIEDEQSMREVETAYLTAAGYAGIEVSTGQEALDRFKSIRTVLQSRTLS